MHIGIDLGGTNIGIGITHNDNLIFKDSRSTNKESGYEGVVKNIYDSIEAILKKNNIKRSDIEGVGIGIPGIIDPKTNMVVEVVNMGWKNVDLKNDLEKILKIPVFLGNDATVAGVAEHEFGALKGYENGVLITLGTGIGAGIIVNGRVFEGAHGIGAEFGHMIVGENYYDCNCGRNGCFETFASSTAIINYTKKLINEGKKTKILDMVNNDVDRIDGKVIFQAAREEDKVAIEVVDRMTDYLAKGIVNIMSILDPEIFVLGGGLSAAGDYLLEQVKKKVEKERYYKGIKAGKICISTIGNDGGILGAACLCKYK